MAWSVLPPGAMGELDPVGRALRTSPIPRRLPQWESSPPTLLPLRRTDPSGVSVGKLSLEELVTLSPVTTMGELAQPSGELVSPLTMSRRADIDSRGHYRSGPDCLRKQAEPVEAQIDQLNYHPGPHLGL